MTGLMKVLLLVASLVLVKGQTSCEPGYAGAPCQACVAGKFSAGGATASTCSVCPAGKWSAEHASACTPCPLENGCLACSATTGACVQCPITAVVTGKGCRACDGGTVPGSGGLYCVGCPVGTYAEPGFATCANCPSGKWSTASATACTDCSPGCANCTGMGLQQATCTACNPATHFRGGEGLCVPTCTAQCFTCDNYGVCTMCASASYWSQLANTCEACPAGKTTHAPNVLPACTTCPSGQYEAGDGVCSACTPGCGICFGPGLGASACYACAPGWNWNADGFCANTCDAGCAQCTQSGCAACRPGYFRDEAGKCIGCPAGTYTDSNNVVTSCSPCAALHSACTACNATGYCQSCSTGYQASQGTCVTAVCPLGCNCAAGTAQCGTCQAGYYRPQGTQACQPCYAGTYSQDYNTRSSCDVCTMLHPQCTQCSTVGVCQACQSAWYPSGNSCAACGTNCTSCYPAGQCTQCHPGYRTQAGAGAACVACGPGKYANGAECKACSLLNGCSSCSQATGECSSCPAGKAIYQTGCSECGTRSYSLGGPTTTCLACGSHCTACDSTTGQCSACDTGYTVQSGPGAACASSCGSLCTSCTNGICTACVAGYIPPPAGGPQCQPCGIGTYALAGDTACKACGSGCLSCNSTSGICITCNGNTVPGSSPGAPCVPCSSGYYRDASQCKPCAAGASQCTATQALVCFSGAEPENGYCCSTGSGGSGSEPGSSCASNNQLSCREPNGVCVDCGPGKYYVDGQCLACVMTGGCTACDPKTGACNACPPGKEPNENSCTDCALGKYKNEWGIMCLNCPMYTGCTACNSTSGQCTQCLPGMQPQGYVCVAAPAASSTATVLLPIPERSSTPMPPIYTLPEVPSTALPPMDIGVGTQSSTALPPAESSTAADTLSDSAYSSTAGEEQPKTPKNETETSAVQVQPPTFTAAPAITWIVPSTLGDDGGVVNVTVKNYLGGVPCAVRLGDKTLPEIGLCNQKDSTSCVISVTIPSPTLSVSRSSYLPLSLRCFEKEQVYNISSALPLLYYQSGGAAALACVSITHYIGKDGCKECPTNAYCPGGDRMWPLKGSWSENEQSLPYKCETGGGGACPGALGEVPGYPPQQVQGAGRLTAYCADGYVGSLCSQCSDGYYREYLNCRPCSGDGKDQAELYGKLAALFIFFGLIALAIALFSEKHLGTAISIISALQQIATLGRVSSSVPLPGAFADFIRALSIFNFDVDFFKPGCSIALYTVPQVFWASLVLLLTAAALLCGAAYIFAVFRRTAGERISAAFRARATQALLILGFLFYLQLSMRIFQGLNCVSIDGVLRLKVEPSTVCYEGDHLPAAIFMWLLLFVYCVGFPSGCFYLLYRARKQNLLESAEASKRYSYLYFGLKLPYFWFRLLQLPTNLFLAMFSAFVFVSTYRVLGNAIVLLVTFAGVIALWPYQESFSNFATAIGSGVVQAQALSLLAFMMDSTDDVDGISFSVRFALFLTHIFLLCAIIVGAGLFRLVRHNRAKDAVQEMGARGKDYEVTVSGPGSTARLREGTQSDSARSLSGEKAAAVNGWVTKLDVSPPGPDGPDTEAEEGLCSCRDGTVACFTRLLSRIADLVLDNRDTVTELTPVTRPAATTTVHRAPRD